MSVAQQEASKITKKFTRKKNPAVREKADPDEAEQMTKKFPRKSLKSSKPPLTRKVSKKEFRADFGAATKDKTRVLC